MSEPLPGPSDPDPPRPPLEPAADGLPAPVDSTATGEPGADGSAAPVGSTATGAAGLAASPQPVSRWERLAFFVALGLVSVVVLLALVPPIGESDLWFHLSTGDWIVRERALPLEEPWAYTAPGRAEVVHGWLADVGLALLRRAAGDAWPLALRLVMPPILLAALVVHGLFLRRQGFAPPLCLALPVVVLALYADRLRLRPDLLSFLIYPLFVWALAAWQESGRLLSPAGLRCLGLVVLWSNLHPASITAPLLAGALWLGARLQASEPRLPVAAPLLVFLATLVNPYGPGSWHYALIVSRDMGRFVDEWAASWAYFDPARPSRWPLAVAPWLALALVAVGWRQASDGPRSPRAWAGVGLLGALLALQRARYVFLGAIPLATCTPTAWRRPRDAHAIGAGLLLLSGAFLAHVQGEFLALTLSGAPSLRPDLPSGAAAFLRELPGPPLRLWQPTAYGAYLADQCPGKVRVFIDGRAPLYGVALLEEQARLVSPKLSPAEKDRIFDGYRVEALVVPHAPAWRCGGAPWFRAWSGGQPRVDVLLHADRAPAHVAAALDLYRARGVDLPADVDLAGAERRIFAFNER